MKSQQDTLGHLHLEEVWSEIHDVLNANKNLVKLSVNSNSFQGSPRILGLQLLTLYISYEDSYENQKFSPIKVQDKQTNLLKVISIVSFDCLSHLYLSYCDLLSIQALAYLDASNLEKIFMENNRITSLQSLKKFHFPYLQVILFNLNKYPYHQITNLTRAKVHRKKVLQVNFNISSGENTPNEDLDVRFMENTLNESDRNRVLADRNFKISHSLSFVKLSPQIVRTIKFSWKGQNFHNKFTRVMCERFQTPTLFH